MAYDTSKLVKLGQMQTIVERIEAEYAAAIDAALANASVADTATDDEVSEMLDSIFGTTDESDDTTEE